MQVAARPTRHLRLFSTSARTATLSNSRSSVRPAIRPQVAHFPYAIPVQSFARTFATSFVLNRKSYMFLGGGGEVACLAGYSYAAFCLMGSCGRQPHVGCYRRRCRRLVLERNSSVSFRSAHPVILPSP
jgi:hypothetical protein